MTSSKRVSTKYPGVFYREVERLGGQGSEKVFYIVFKKDGKVLEEKVGRQFADDMSASKASIIRAERIEGKRESRKEIRLKAESEKRALLNRPTVGYIWQEYQLQNPTKKSLATDGYNFKSHLTGFADKTPDEIYTADLAKLKSGMAAKGYKPATIKHAIVLLRMLIRFGVRQGYCTMPDPAKLQFEVPRVDNQKTEMLTQEQLIAFEKALSEEVDQNSAAFMRLALLTGMRKGALMGLRWEDIDFTNNIITLRGEVAKKGKTERIPLNSSARVVLESVQRTDSPYVFPGKDGGPRKDFRRVAKRVKAKAGLPDDFRPLHGLRHTYASYLASSGKVDLYTLQKLLTHSSPQMTQRYAHLADEAMQRAASVADDVFTISSNASAGE